MLPGNSANKVGCTLLSQLYDFEKGAETHKTQCYKMSEGCKQRSRRVIYL